MKKEQDKGIKVGDIVTLKVGGPKMVVGLIRSNGVDCYWFNESAYNFVYSSFTKESLKKWNLNVKK